MSYILPCFSWFFLKNEGGKYMGGSNLKTIFITACCFVLALFSVAQCMDERTDKLDAARHFSVSVTDDDQQLIDRITKKIDKYERKANDLKILLEKFKTFEIDEKPIHTTPEIGSIGSPQTTPIRGDEEDISALNHIMEEELKGLTKEEKIKIVSPNVKVGTNTTNIYRGIVGGTRKDSPPSKCVANYQKWKKEQAKGKPTKLSFEKKETPEDE